MKKMKKIIAVLTAAVISVTALVTTAFTASAYNDFSNPKSMKENQTYSHFISKWGQSLFYEIKIPSKGTISINVEEIVGDIDLRIYNEDEKKIFEEIYFSSGYNFELENMAAGTYYIEFWAYNNKSSFENFYYDFTSNSKITTSNSESKATIALKLEKGDSFKIAVVASDYDGKIKWTTTKKSVATISKGKVTAKGEGKARIRAYLDDGSYTEIMVIVE